MAGDDVDLLKGCQQFLPAQPLLGPKVGALNVGRSPM